MIQFFYQLNILIFLMANNRFSYLHEIHFMVSLHNYTHSFTSLFTRHIQSNGKSISNRVSPERQVKDFTTPH